MDRFVIMTGAPGTGKSTLLNVLREQGLNVVEEPARQILAEQRACGGRGLPEVDAALFTRLMRERALEQYHAAAPRQDVTIFDRGLPDYIAYAQHFGLRGADEIKAAEDFRYHPRVFICPPWESIYTTDSERKMGFAAVQEFHETLLRIYEGLGYQLCELPRRGVHERARFLLAQLGTSIK